jgi:hypothetical protein
MYNNDDKRQKIHILQAVSMFLQNEFPQLIGKISGEHYPTPPIAELVSHIVALLQMLALAGMVVGVDKLCGMVGLQPHQVPSFLRSMEQNSIWHFIVLINAPIGRSLFAKRGL